MCERQSIDTRALFVFIGAVPNTAWLVLTDAEVAAEVARDTGEVLLAVTHPGGSHPAGKAERTFLAPGRTPLELERRERNR